MKVKCCHLIYELYCYCWWSVMTLKLYFNNGGIVFMLPSIMAKINPDWILHCHMGIWDYAAWFFYYYFFFFLLERMLMACCMLSSPAGCRELSENTLYNCHYCFSLNISPSIEVPLDFRLHRNTYQYKWFIQNLSLPITIMLSEDRITSGRIRYECGLFCCKVADQMCVYAFFHQIGEMQEQM